MRTERPQAIYLKDYCPPDYLIDSVHLDFQLDPVKTLVTAKLQMRANAQDGQKEVPLVLVGEQLKLISLHLDDRALEKDEDFVVTDEDLTLLMPPRQFTLTIKTEINPSENKAYEGLYLSDGLFCTQCEAEGFRKITYYLDRPDVMARFTTRITADKNAYPILLSNGNPTEHGDNEDGTHWMAWVDPFRKPAYLFALVAGDLVKISDSYTTSAGKDVALEIFVEAENKHKCAHALKSLKHAMKWDEEVFGLCYDLDIYMIVAVNNFNMGAMENKGLNVFNSKYVLANPETATDHDFLAVEGVIGHEYFHNWTGNRVTLRDWFQLSLKEGLTVFRDQEFSSDMYSRAVKRIEDVNLLRTIQFVEDSGPTAHPIRPDSYIEMNNFYTVTVYEKGAEVIRMLQTLMGRKNFLHGVELYIRRHDGRAVTTDDFVKAMEDANDMDLSQFRLWYSQAGTPTVSVTWQHDIANKTFHLTVEQTCPPTPNQAEKLPMHIPLDMALLDANGQHVPLKLKAKDDGSDSLVLDITQPTQTFTFHDVGRAVTPSLLRNFSAPVHLKAPYSDADLAFLLENETDPVNQWDAGQRLLLQAILRLVKQHENGETLEVDNAILFDSIASVLSSETLDPALIASIIQLPQDNIVSEQLDVVNPDSIFAAKKVLKETLAKQCFQQFNATYQKLASTAEYSLDKQEIARRSLRGVCLNYLVRSGEKSVIQQAYDQFESADNMTEKLSALHALNHIDCPERKQALQAFYAQWSHDPLVVNKWFSAQAVSELPDTLEIIKLLVEHESFELSNPNNVYALLVCFSKQNLKHFHATTGAAYKFIAETVLKLDKMNPQVAARLVSAFLHWRRYDETRQNLMKHELEAILNEPSLSKDVFELVSRSLAA